MARLADGSTQWTREVPALRPPRAGSTARSFGAYQVYPTGSWAEAVAIGDVTGDDAPDVVVVTSFAFDPTNDNAVHVFPQTADRGIPLGPRVTYPAGDNPQSVTIGDVNGDGRNDVIVANSFGVGVLYQDSSGTLDSVKYFSSPDNFRVRVADLNGDGRDDIVAVGWNTHTVSVFLQLPDGSLAAPAVYSAPHAGWEDLEVGDVNGDGRSDVVVMSGQSYAVPDFSVLYQQPEGTLGGLITRDVGGSDDLAGGIGVGDVNGDGRADVVVAMGWAGVGTEQIAVFHQDASGALPATPVTLPIYQHPEPLEVGDLTGDGLADVLFFEAGLYLHLMPQLPGGALGSGSSVAVPSATHLNRHALAIGDLDLDGRNDVAIACPGFGLVVLRQTSGALGERAAR